MKRDRLNSVDKLIMKACDAINAINEFEKTLCKRVGLKTTLTLNEKRSLEIDDNILKAKQAMHEVMRCISEGSKVNRSE